MTALEFIQNKKGKNWLYNLNLNDTAVKFSTVIEWMEQYANQKPSHPAQEIDWDAMEKAFNAARIPLEENYKHLVSTIDFKYDTFEDYKSHLTSNPL